MTQPTTHQYYRNPYQVKLATPKQYEFLLKLVREYDYSDVALDHQITILQNCRDGKRTPMTRKAASDMIEAVQRSPKRSALGISQHEAPELEDGYYDAAGRTFKLLTSLQGRKYAKVLNDQGKWVYAPGAASIIATRGQKLSLDRAKELGKLYGRCIICGATLTDEKSIEAGIGPVCARKF